MLDGVATERWAYQVSTFTECGTESESVLNVLAPGKTQETFSLAKAAWIRSYFDTQFILVMQDYLTTNIKFLTHKNISVKDWASRLTKNSRKLLRFPHQEGANTV